MPAGFAIHLLLQCRPVVLLAHRKVQVNFFQILAQHLVKIEDERIPHTFAHGQQNQQPRCDHSPRIP
jgi:hypothetical protein